MSMGRFMCTWCALFPMMQPGGMIAQFLQQQQQRLTALGGQLHFLPYKSRPEDDLWEVAKVAQAVC